MSTEKDFKKRKQIKLTRSHNLIPNLSPTRQTQNKLFQQSDTRKLEIEFF